MYYPFALKSSCSLKRYKTFHLHLLSKHLPGTLINHYTFGSTRGDDSGAVGAASRFLPLPSQMLSGCFGMQQRKLWGARPCSVRFLTFFRSVLIPEKMHAPLHIEGWHFSLSVCCCHLQPFSTCRCAPQWHSQLWKSAQFWPFSYCSCRCSSYEQCSKDFLYLVY